MEEQFDRECNEYGCMTLCEKRNKAANVLVVQTEPKDRKNRRKELEQCWKNLKIGRYLLQVHLTVVGAVAAASSGDGSSGRYLWELSLPRRDFTPS